MLTKVALPLRTGMATQLQIWMGVTEASLGPDWPLCLAANRGGRGKPSHGKGDWCWRRKPEKHISLWDQVNCSLVNCLRSLYRWTPLPHSNKESIEPTSQHRWIILKGKIRDCRPVRLTLLKVVEKVLQEAMSRHWNPNRWFNLEELYFQTHI